MILSEFSKYIQSRNEDIVSNKATGTKILCDWIELVINKNPKNNVDKIVLINVKMNGNIGDYYVTNNQNLELIR